MCFADPGVLIFMLLFCMMAFDKTLVFTRKKVDLLQDK